MLRTTYTFCSSTSFDAAGVDASIATAGASTSCADSSASAPCHGRYTLSENILIKVINKKVQQPTDGIPRIARFKPQLRPSLYAQWQCQSRPGRLG
jgi:hypothetical protein